MKRWHVLLIAVVAFCWAIYSIYPRMFSWNQDKVSVAEYLSSVADKPGWDSGRKSLVMSERFFNRDWKLEGEYGRCLQFTLSKDLLDKHGSGRQIFNTQREKGFLTETYTIWRGSIEDVDWVVKR